MKNYIIDNKVQLIRDKESLNYYLKNNNYLINLKALLSLLEKELSSSKKNQLIKNSLLNIIDELDYVNKNYSLTKLKKKNKSKTPK